MIRALIDRRQSFEEEAMTEISERPALVD